MLPLWHSTDAFQALREVGISMERSHHLSRVRKRVDTKDTLNRPKRIGREVQQRANASIITDWLLILFRQGWLPQTILRGADAWATEPWEAGEGERLPLPRARASAPSVWRDRDIHTTELGEEFVYGDMRNPEQP